MYKFNHTQHVVMFNLCIVNEIYIQMYISYFDYIIICNHFPLFATTIPPITRWHVYVGAYVNLNYKYLITLYISFIQT
jgi:hypothetical protein